MANYKPVIGLEIHVELKTRSKMFCQCSADYFGKKPNTNVCPVCLGLPGALPVPNKKTVEWTIKIGQALNCTINKISKFDRKHYFYPDLPKGYQISQYDEPLAVKGYLKIRRDAINHVSTDDEEKKFRITRVHLEEDTGKLLHSGDDTLIDFNRSSVPLVEIVTEPDFESADDVKRFLEELQVIIRYLDVSDADMEKGSMRMEPNISVKKIINTESSKIISQVNSSRKLSSSSDPDDKMTSSHRDSNSDLPKYKVEVKNINSPSFVKKAIEYEIKRHIEILEKGELPKQETRGWDDKKNITYSQRSKEEAHDYRYFPEPDIPPMEFDEKFLESIKNSLPELPAEKVNRYVTALGLRYADAFNLTRDISTVQYYETVISKIKDRKDIIKNQNIEQSLANYIINKKLSTQLSPEKFIEEAVKLLTPKQTDTALLEKVITTVIEGNPKVVEDIKAGKENAIMFLVGQVMREMKGQADATTVREELRKKI